MIGSGDQIQSDDANSNGIIGRSISYIMDELHSVNIDSMIDFYLAESLIKNLKD